MSDRGKELVILLHGIGMPKMRMSYVEHRLKKHGFKTLNIAYPSLRKNMEDCADFVQQKIERSIPDGIEKIHFIAHSMGSLVALDLLCRNTVEKASRAVLVAPPYQGSEVADFAQGLPMGRSLLGPSGKQLTTQYRKNISFDVPQDIEIGVIAGTRAYEYPFFLSVMKKTGDHDGLVSVASTRIPGVADHITMGMSHSFLIEKSVTQAVHFLKHGCFRHKIA